MIGSVISHYKIVSELGRGGMGIVYKAQDTRLDRSVAIKMLPSQQLASEDEKARFFREAQASAALNHPHIATVFEIDEEDNQSFIVMEYVDGPSLKDRIEEGPLKLDDAIRLAIQIASGLEAAHEAGIVHRDIKPANVMLTKKGEAKIMDFGLAKLSDQTTLTKTGTTLGTAAYMSPEQARGEKVDARSDIFALGVVIYEMIAGRMAFQGAYAEAVVYSILNVDPDPLTSLRTGVPMELERFVDKALAKNPSERYQGATDLIVDLKYLGKAVERGSTYEAHKESRVHPIEKVKVTRIDIRTVIFPAIAVIAIIGLVLLGRLYLLRTASETAIDSIAVLPMVNMTGDTNNEFITDGMTEALINELGRIQALNRVISFTSVRPYKDAMKPLPAIGAELGVSAIVESFLRLSGAEIHIEVRLLNAQSDARLWEQSYQRALEDVSSLQREVALAISQELEVALSPSESVRLADTRPVNPDAHRAYLQGRFFFNKWTEDGFDKALEYFQTAVQIDSTYALAFAGLSDAYNILGNLGLRPQEEVSPMAKTAALRALELDESLAEAHLSLASIWLSWEWKFEEGEREINRALELNPNYVMAHQWTAEMSAFKGQFDKALQACRRALELDPLSIPLTYDFGWISYWAGEYDQASVYIEKAIELDPNKAEPYFFLSLSYHAMGMNEEAIAAHLNYVERRGLSSEIVTLVQEIYRVDGLPGVWDWELRNLQQQATERFVAPGHLAWFHALAGEKESAFDWLEKAFSGKSIEVLTLKGDPVWKAFGDDPRYLDMVARVGLPE